MSCLNCKMPEEAHAKGKCLFLPTYYADPLAAPKAAQRWFRQAQRTLAAIGVMTVTQGPAHEDVFSVWGAAYVASLAYIFGSAWQIMRRG